MKKYSIIYTDFPWRYNSRANHKTRFRGGAYGHYPLMSMEEIKKLPIDQLGEDNSALFMWCTFPYLDEQIKLFEHWGYRYRTVAFTWIKTNPKNNKPFFGVGYYTKCLKGDTKIYLRNKRTDDVVHTTLYMLHNVLDFRDWQIHTPNGWRNITGTQKNNNTSVCEITTSLGNITTSLNHKLFYKSVSTSRVKGTNRRVTRDLINCSDVLEIKRKWKLATNSSRGSTNLLFSLTPVVRKSPINAVNGIDLNSSFGWVMGLFCAEGNYGKGNQIRFTLHSEEIDYVNNIQTLLNELNLPGDRFYNSSIKAHTHKIKGANSVAVYFNSVKIKSVFSEFIVGEGAHGKRLNVQKFLNTSVDFRKAFIDGMLSGDGFLEQGKYTRLTICNEGLRNDLRQIMHSVGIPTRASEQTATAVAGGKRFNTYKLGVIQRGKTLEFEGTNVKALEIKNFNDLPDKIETYDISVEGEVFVANDIVSHNSNAEVCLLGIRGKMKPVSNAVSSVIISPRREHSRKPDEARERIVQLFGDVPRVELFARQRVEGWDQYGNDLDGRDIRDVLKKAS